MSPSTLLSSAVWNFNLFLAKPNPLVHKTMHKYCRVCVWVQYNTALYFNIIIIKRTIQIVQGETVNNYAARESLLEVKSYLKSHTSKGLIIINKK